MVETEEFIELNSNLAAFGFPPASLARNAILMTNPGHVDPGYSGHLSFTLINMGREPYQINHGDGIVSLLVFKFSKRVSANYSERRNGKVSPPNYKAMLNMLAPDFGAYSARMAKAAEIAVGSQLHSLDMAKLWVPAFAGAVTSAVAAVLIWFSSYLTDIGQIVTESELLPLQSQVTELKSEIEKIGAIADAVQLDDRLDQLQKRLDELSSGPDDVRGQGVVQ